MRSLVLAAVFTAASVSGGRVDCPQIALDPLDASNYCSQMAIEGTLRQGSLCLLRPEQIHPTQHAIGKAAMHCHRRQLEHMSSKELLDYRLSNQVPVFVGPPHNTLYISDKHHLSTAMFEAELEYEHHMLHRALFACIQDDLSNLEVGAFWTYMNETGNCYPFDHFGHSIPFDEIPSSLKKLRDDPFRTLSRYVRTSRGFVKCNKKTTNLPVCQEEGTAPFFIEFKWADYLRNKLPAIRDTSKPQIRPHNEDYIYETNYQSQIDALRVTLPQAVSFALSESSDHMPGFNRDPRLYKPSLAEIDEFGCDNDPSQ